MKIRFKYILFVLIVIAFGTTVYASTSSELENEVLTNINKQYFGDSFNPPYGSTQTKENVSLANGELSLSKTDLYLPGKNGLDVTLKRSFRSSNVDKGWCENVYQSEKGRDCKAYLYHDETKNTDLYVYFATEEVMYKTAPDEFYAIGTFPKRAIKSDNKTKTTYYIYDYILAKTSEEQVRHLVRNKSVPAKVIQRKGYYDLDPVWFSDKYLIGSSRWTFELPEICTQITGGYGNVCTCDGYFRDWDGNIYGMKYDYIVDRTVDANNFYILNDNDIFTTEYLSYKSEEHEPGIVYTQTVTDNKGRKMYFNSTGRIIAVKDKYGNKISFSYADNKLTSITDTFGRVITLSYTDDTMTLSYEDGNGEIQSITYAASVEYNENDPNNLLSVDDKYLLTVTDEKGNSTVYKHDYIQPITCATSSGGGTEIDTYLSGESYVRPSYGIRLTEIVHPTGYVTKYEYIRKSINLYRSGYKGHEKVISRYDIADNEELNRYDYTYSNLKEGRPDNKYYSGTQTRAADGYKITTEYNGSAAPYIIKKYSGNISNPDVQIRNEYNIADDQCSSKPVHLISQTVTAERTATTSYTYDKYLNILSETTDAGTVSYTYDNTYNMPLTTSYNQDGNKEIIITNTLTTDKKSIAETTVTENNVLKAKTAYTYDSFGNVIKTRVWEKDTNGDGILDDTDKFVDVNAEYTYNDDKTYSIYKYVEDLKNADGSTITAVDPRYATDSKIGYTYNFDSLGNVVSNTSPSGNTITLSYDKLNRPVSKTFSDNTQKTVFFDDVENYIIAADENGTETKYNYDPLGRLVKKSVKNAGIWVTLEEYIYDGVGRVAETRTYRNAVDYISTLNEYDGQDRLIKQTVKNEQGQTETEYTVSYAAVKINNKYHLKVTTSYMADGNVTPASNSKYYDNMNRLVKEETSSGETTYATTYTYDNVGNVISKTNPRANAANGTASETYEYDYAGNIVKITNALGDSAASAYDMSGKKISDTDYMGNITEYTHDKLGRVVKTSSPFGNGETAETKSFYNADGYLVKTQVKKAENEYDETVYEYDSKGRTVREAVDYRGINYTYDPAGRLTSRILSANAAPKTTTYEYDFLNHKTKETSPLGYFETYAYDYTGNLISQTDEMNNTLEMSYNARNLVTSKKANGEAVCSYTYSPLGSLKQSQNSDTTIVYTYDPFNRLISETDTSAANTYIKNYTYDEENNRKSFVLTINGTQKQNVSYDYDMLNRLISVSDGGENISYAYDKNGKLLNRNIGTHTEESYSYNGAGLPVSKVSTVNNTVVNSAQIEYYTNGNQKRISQLGKPPVSYVYEGDGMLRTENVEGEYVNDYVYNTAGNMMGKYTQYADNHVRMLSFGWDDNNRMTASSVRNTDESGTYTYDDAGRLTQAVRSSIPETYSYDIFGRIVSGTKGNVSFEYTYDANGLRTSKTVDGVTTYYVYDGENIIAEISGGDTTVYLRDNTGIVSRTRGNAKEYFVSNYRGDISAVVNSDADIIKSYDYEAFGSLKNASAADDNPFRYCGEYFDDETGFVYLRNRYYDPSIGRFTTEDPAKSGLNWYAYCENNPVKYIDPWGLIPTTKEAAAMAEHIYSFNTSDSRYDRTISGWRLIDVWFGRESMKMGIYIPDNDDWTNPTEYAVVFKGTSNAKNWQNNAEAFISSKSADVWDAINYSVGFTKEHSQEITFVGHSKGGGEAIAAATATNKNAITFNAANFNFPKYGLTEKNKSGIKNYYVRGEILYNTIGYARYGTTQDLLPTQEWLYNKTINFEVFGKKVYKEIKVPDPVGNHLMSAVRKALR